MDNEWRTDDGGLLQRNTVQIKLREVGCLFPLVGSLSKRLPLKPGTRLALDAFLLFFPLFISTSNIVRPLFLPRRHVCGELFLTLRPDQT